MALEYCFPLEDPTDHTIRRVCVPIPVNLWPWLDGIWPWLPRLDPISEPWINDERLDSRVARDLTILATITKLTEQLSPELSETLHNGIKRAVEQIQLPTEVTVGF